MSDLHSPRTLVPAAVLSIGIGGLLAWVTSTAHPGLGVPPLIAFGAALMFVLTAARLLQLALRPRSSGDVWAALITGGLAMVGGWIAFAPGARSCSTNAFGDATLTGLACRLPFGIGALLCAAMAGYAAARWVRQRSAAEPDSTSA